MCDLLVLALKGLELEPVNHLASKLCSERVCQSVHGLFDLFMTVEC